MTKKLNRMLLIAVLTCALVCAFAACNPESEPANKLTVKSIAVEGLPTEPVTQFSIAGAKVVVTMSDDTKKNVDLSWAMISEEDRNKLGEVGTHEITVRYEGASTTVSIEIVAPDPVNPSEPSEPEIKSGTVNFKTNGGTEIKSVSAEIGQSVQKPADPVKEYKTFAGWYTDKKYEYPAVFPYKVTAASTTLYAKWNDEFVQVRYMMNETDLYKVIEGAVKGDQLPSVDNPERNGYKFGKWCTTPDCAEQFGTKKVVSDVTVYAKWIPNEHNLYFDLNSGKIPDVYVLEADAAAAKRYVFELQNTTGAYVNESGLFVPYDISKPSHAGLDRYTPVQNENGNYVKNRFEKYVPYKYSVEFSPDSDGYYVKDGEKYVPYDSANAAHSALEKYKAAAVPDENGAYVLQAGSNKGTFSVSVAFDTEIKPCITPVKAGFTFRGWFDENGVPFEFSANTRMPDGEKYIYAKWDIADDEAFFSYKTDIDGKLVITGASDNIDDAKTAEGLVIPSTIGGVSVKGIADGAFRRYEYLEELTIEEGIVSVGSNAFADSPLSGEVIIPDSLTDIGYRAFGAGVIFENKDGFRLKGVRAGDVFNYTVIKYEGAETVQFPTFADGSKVVEIGAGAFEEQKIGGITIPKTVRKIGAYAFRKAVITVSAFLVESGSELEYIHPNAFDGTALLTSSGNKSLILGSVFYKYLGTNAGSIEIPDYVRHLSEGLFLNAGDEATFNFADETNILTVGKNAFSTGQIRKRIGPDEEWFVLNGILVKYIGKGGFITVPTDKGIKKINVKAFEGASSTYIKSITFTENTYDGVNAIEFGANAFSGLTNTSFVFSDADNATDGSPVPEICDTTFCSVPKVTYSVLSGIKLLFNDDKNFIGGAWDIYRNKGYFDEFGVREIKIKNGAVNAEYFLNDELSFDITKLTIVTNNGDEYFGKRVVSTAPNGDITARFEKNDGTGYDVIIRHNFDSATAFTDYTKIDSVLKIKNAETGEYAVYDAATHGALSEIDQSLLAREFVYYVKDGEEYVAYDGANAAHAQLTKYYRGTMFDAEGFSAESKRYFYFEAKEDEPLYFYADTANQGEVANYQWLPYEEGKYFESAVYIKPYKELNFECCLTDGGKVAETIKKYYVKPKGSVLENSDTPIKKDYNYLDEYDNGGALDVTYNFGTFDTVAVRYAYTTPVSECAYENFDTSVIKIEADGSLSGKTLRLKGDGFDFDVAYTVRPLELNAVEPISVLPIVNGYNNGLKNYYLQDGELVKKNSFITRNYAGGKTDNVSLDAIDVIKTVDGFNTETIAENKKLTITYYVYEFDGTKWNKVEKVYEHNYVVDAKTPTNAFEFALGTETITDPTTGEVTTRNYAILKKGNPLPLNGKDIVIPMKAKINETMYDVEVIAAGAFENCGSSSTKLTIPVTVRNIEEGAFKGTKFATVAFVSDSALTAIPAGAFKGAAALTGVEYGTRITAIGKHAFEGSGINEYSPTKFSGITSIGAYAFKDCAALASVNLTGVSEVGIYAFSNCAALTTVDFAAVADLGMYAFANCAALTSAVLPANITVVPTALFKGSKLLTTVTIPGAVTAIGDMAFSDCAALTTVNITSADGITAIGDYAFNGCAALTTVPDFIALKTVGKEAFANAGITSISLSSTVEKVGEDAFKGCKSVTDITVESDFGNNKLPDGIFRYMEGVTTVQLGTITKIGERSFEGCKALQTVSGTTSLSEIGAYAFKGCAALTTVDFGSVTLIGDYAFEGAGNLGAIALPELTTLGDYAFKNSGVSGVSFGNKLTAVSKGAFEGSNLTSLTIPATITSIGESSFSQCAELLTVVISEGNRLATIGKGAFKGDTKLATLTIGASVKENRTYKVPLTIGNNAFEDCDKLENLYFPGSVKSIGDNAFRNATIKEISFGVVNKPVWVMTAGGTYDEQNRFVLADEEFTAPLITSIGKGAFGDSGTLNKIYLGAMTPPTLGAEAFSSNANIELYIIDDDAAYNAAYDWLKSGGNANAIRKREILSYVEPRTYFLHNPA